MPLAQETKVAPPLKIFGILQMQWAQQILTTAVELDVFSQLAEQPLSGEEVAQRIKCDARAATLLLDALASLEFLQREGNRYELTQVARDYLVRDSKYYFGPYIMGREKVAESWKQLTSVIKSGQPIAQVNTDKQAEEFFPALAAAIFPINFSTAEMLADVLKISQLPAGARVLDLAAGSAVWSIPMAQSNAKLQVDALDFPAVLRMTDQFTKKHGVSAQYKHLEGSWRDVKLDNDSYDVIVLGHILHSEGWQLSEELIRVCFNALKKGGRLVIGEYFKNHDRPGPEFASMFAVNMLLMTTEGCVFSVEDLQKMTQSAGFKSAERLVLPHWEELTPIVVAQK